MPSATAEHRWKKVWKSNLSNSLGVAKSAVFSERRFFAQPCDGELRAPEVNHIITSLPGPSNLTLSFFPTAVPTILEAHSSTTPIAKHHQHHLICNTVSDNDIIAFINSIFPGSVWYGDYGLGRNAFVGFLSLGEIGFPHSSDFRALGYPGMPVGGSIGFSGESDGRHRVKEATGLGGADFEGAQIACVGRPSVPSGGRWQVGLRDDRELGFN